MLCWMNAAAGVSRIVQIDFEPTLQWKIWSTEKLMRER